MLRGFAMKRPHEAFDELLDRGVRLVAPELDWLLQCLLTGVKQFFSLLSSF